MKIEQSGEKYSLTFTGETTNAYVWQSVLQANGRTSRQLVRQEVPSDALAIRLAMSELALRSLWHNPNYMTAAAESPLREQLPMLRHRLEQGLAEASSAIIPVHPESIAEVTARQLYLIHTALGWYMVAGAAGNEQHAKLLGDLRQVTQPYVESMPAASDPLEQQLLQELTAEPHIVPIRSVG